MTPSRSRCWLAVSVLAVALVGWTLAGRAVAQSQPGPHGPPATQPGPAQRPGRPGLPHGAQPSAAPRGGGRPPPVRSGHTEREDAHKGGGHEAACPGHGPTDPPGHVNWWEGVLMVNNDRAGAPDAKLWERLLFRYENTADPCDPKNLPAPFLASLINFGLLAFVVVRFGKKPIAEALAKRRESIMQEIDAATKLRRDAKGRLRDYRRKFDKLEETLSELREEYRRQADSEQKRVLAEAAERRARLVRDAELRIEQERKAAHVDLLHEAAVGAVGAAEQLLKARVRPADHERLADEYLGSVAAAVRSAQTSATGGRA